jgi:hypothetical protein
VFGKWGLTLFISNIGPKSNFRPRMVRVRFISVSHKMREPLPIAVSRGTAVGLTEGRRTTMRKQQIGAALAATACVTALVLGWTAWRPMNAAPAQAGGFGGKVLCANSPISGSAVTLYAAGEGQPLQLAQGKTGEDGTFNLDVSAEKLKGSADKVLYLVEARRRPARARGPMMLSCCCRCWERNCPRRPR